MPLLEILYYHKHPKKFTPTNLPGPQKWCSMKLNGTHKVTEFRKPVSDVLAYAIRFILDLLPYSESLSGEGHCSADLIVQAPAGRRGGRGKARFFSLTSNALGSFYGCGYICITSKLQLLLNWPRF